MEVLVEHSFVRYIDAIGVCHSACIIKEPIPMLHGKDHLATWGICREGLFVAREGGTVAFPYATVPLMGPSSVESTGDPSKST